MGYYVSLLDERLTDAQFNMLQNFIQKTTGIKMPYSKKIMVEGRLRKRLMILKMGGFSEYIAYVFDPHNGGEESIYLIDAITTNKTEFFRETAHFDFMRKKAIPDILRRISQRFDGQLKIWSAPCSTGEEAYSIAISLEEEKLCGLQISDFLIFATDISTAALEIAGNGVYKLDSIKDISDTIKKRYFLKSKNERDLLVKVKPYIRKKCVFERLNFMDDEYGIKEKFHIVFCRNVLIYFEKNVQHLIIERLLKYLDKGGYLFLGHSESLYGLDLPVKKTAPSVYVKI
jgi:chemotaxis protein methyltransferase CheR